MKSRPDGPVLLPAVEELPAAHLTGMRLHDGWTVLEMLERSPGATGSWFSICYKASGPKGQIGFLKALNIAVVLDPTRGSIVDQMKAFLDSYVFERNLLAQCRERRLGRIIRLISFGEVEVEGAGLLRTVPYLILELAEGDIREHQSKLDAFDIAWVLRTLKHATLGIEQLHSCHIAHQDLKPSNVLIQNEGREMKLGDLGRAEIKGMDGPTSTSRIPGALGYAPPEQIYGAFDHSWELRRAADVYHLGSLAAQLFLGHSMTALLFTALPKFARPGFWRGDFSTVLPYLRSAHATVMEGFEDTVNECVTSGKMKMALVRVVREMTDPDPWLRGHPRDRAARTSSFAVRRYVSIFNRLATEAEFALTRRS